MPVCTWGTGSLLFESPGNADRCGVISDGRERQEVVPRHFGVVEALHAAKYKSQVMHGLYFIRASGPDDAVELRRCLGAMCLMVEQPVPSPHGEGAYLLLDLPR
jgi:hypothetical protein